MNILGGLQSKKNQEVYQLLLLLEQRSAGSGELYGCFEEFIRLLTNKSSFVQVRDFRPACARRGGTRKASFGKAWTRFSPPSTRPRRSASA